MQYALSRLSISLRLLTLSIPLPASRCNLYWQTKEKKKRKEKDKLKYRCAHRRTRGGGGGLLQPPPPRIVQNGNFRSKIHVIFGQNQNLLFGQALDKIFGQKTSAPPPPPTKLVPYAYVCALNVLYAACVRLSIRLNSEEYKENNNSIIFKFSGKIVPDSLS